MKKLICIICITVMYSCIKHSSSKIYKSESGKVVSIFSKQDSKNTSYFIDTLYFSNYGENVKYIRTSIENKKMYEIYKKNGSFDTTFSYKGKKNFYTHGILKKYINKNINIVEMDRYKDVILKKIKFERFNFSEKQNQISIFGSIYYHKDIAIGYGIETYKQIRENTFDFISSEFSTPLEIIIDGKKIFPHTRLEKNQVREKLKNLKPHPHSELPSE